MPFDVARAGLVALRGATVGILATLADLLALLTLVHFGMSPSAASFPALAFGVAVQFVGSKRFTFENRSREWLGQGAKFLLVEAAAFGLNLLVFEWGVKHTAIPFVVVRLLGTSLVYFAFSLPLWSLVFRPTQTRNR